MNKTILKKIKSKSILNYIFDFINGNKIVLKLIKHSKYFQKLLGINIYDYQNFYFTKSKFPLSDYLLFDNNKEIENEKKFDKNLLKGNLDKYLIKNPQLTKDDINKYVNEYYKKYGQILKEEKNKEQSTKFTSANEKLIDIYSPFFDLLSKDEFFGDIFSINIPLNLIEENNLKNDYISIFDNLGKYNSNYSSLYIKFKDTKDLNILDDFKIKFSQIKKFDYVIPDDNSIENQNDFLNKICSFFPKENCLKYLNLGIPSETENEIEYEIENDTIEKINNFKILEYLEIKNFIIKNPFILKLYNLKKLKIQCCQNLTFAENSLLNLKKLEIDNSIINTNEYLLKIPNVKFISFLSDVEETNMDLVFDFSSIQNLKTLICNKYEFLKINHINNSSLETVFINSTKNISNDIEKQVIEKLLSLKKLKRVLYGLSSYTNEEILKIKGENLSVEKLSLMHKNIDNENIINNCINKFPNAHDFSLVAFNCEFSHEDFIYIEIKEDPHSKIKSFQVEANRMNAIKFNCSSYENLTDVGFNIKGRLYNFKYSFPIFNNKCNVIFKSLISFKLIIPELNLYNLEVILNNLDKMPNLESFKLQCIIEDITEEYYKKVIDKLLKKNLKIIELNIKKKSYEENIYYSKKELLEINKDLELNNFNDIKIHKINDIPSISQFMKFYFNDFN